MTAPKPAAGRAYLRGGYLNFRRNTSVLAAVVTSVAVLAGIGEAGLSFAGDPVEARTGRSARAGPPEAPFIQAPPMPAPHPDMTRLAFLIGSWDIRIEGLDRAGKVIHESTGRLDTHAELGGQLLVSLGFAPNSSAAQRNWKFYNRARQKLYDVNFDLAGNFEVREDVSQGGDVAFALVDPFRGTDGVARNWRKTYQRVSRDVYVVLTDYSEDGATWVLAFRETYARRTDRGGA